ncbi:MAG: hypothetical protein ACOYUB_01425 [Patescibacteria group bacterium]
MIGPGTPSEVKQVLTISSHRLAAAVDNQRHQISIEDKSKNRGGHLYLPKDIPVNSFVAILIDSEPKPGDAIGSREKFIYRVTRNGDEVEIDGKGIPQAVDTLIEEKIPVSPGKADKSIKFIGDETTWEEVARDNETYGVTLNLPMQKGLTGGVVSVITPATFNNYKSAVLGIR